MLVLALVGLMHSASAATDLDAPVDQKPTIRSEIHRGIAAARSCYFANVLDVLNFDRCIEREETKNETTSADHRYFALGLFFEAWFWDDMYITTPAPDSYARAAAEEAARFAPINFKAFRKYQVELGISYEQIFAVGGWGEAGKRGVQARVAYWSAKVFP